MARGGTKEAAVWRNYLTVGMCWCGTLSGLWCSSREKKAGGERLARPSGLCVWACMCVRCWFQADLKGSHPDSASGRLGERWRGARTEHETDRKQIGPEPVAINHHRGAGPSHSSHMHATHRRTFTHTNMHSRKWNVATRVKSPTANTLGNRREKNHSSYFFFLPPPPRKHNFCL